ncbi:helix-turn-helix domain-containing protein [Kiloniella spongiae]|uniref:helix-turn-helix domain-containing protein n=1 Tax=Kiloniella spongiae TaxID=1489064 RepID=UPI00069AE724|nr:helix-turn-helix domain-containing protein [Kiloniella spongiae]
MKTQFVENQTMAYQFFMRFFSQWDKSCPDISIDKILAPMGYNKNAIVKEKQKVNIDTYYKTLLLVAPSCWNRGFFLHLGHSYNIFDLGLLGYALVSTTNLQRSWELSSALLFHPIKTERKILNDRVEIILQSLKLNEFQSKGLSEEWLTSTWKWTCQRLPQIQNCQDVEIRLSYAKPDHTEFYENIFPGKILFNQLRTSFSFPIEFNAHPFSSASSSVSKLCFEHSIATLPFMHEANHLVDDVRLYLLQTANIAFSNIEETAEHFGLSIHTFQRRLSKNGTSFRKVLYESRMTLARQYLLGTELTINEIAYLTGYEHPPSFYRAFHKKFNLTPEQFRATQEIA